MLVVSCTFTSCTFSDVVCFKFESSFKFFFKNAKSDDHNALDQETLMSDDDNWEPSAKKTR